MTKSVAERRNDEQADKYIQIVMLEWAFQTQAAIRKLYELICESVPSDHNELNMIETKNAKGRKVRFYDVFGDGRILKAHCLEDYFCDAHGVESEKQSKSRPIYERIQSNKNEVIAQFKHYKKRILCFDAEQIRLLHAKYVACKSYNEIVASLTNKPKNQKKGTKYKNIKCDGVTIKCYAEDNDIDPTEQYAQYEKELKREIARAEKDLSELLFEARYG